VGNTEPGGLGGVLGCMAGEIGVHMDIIPHIPVIGNNANHPAPGALLHGVVIHQNANK